MSTAMSYFCEVEKREGKEVVPGVHIRTFWGQEMLLAVVDLEPGAVVPEHSHVHEQMGTVVSGELTLTIDGETRHLGVGATYIIPGGVRHAAGADDGPVRLTEIFYPIREEYQY